MKKILNLAFVATLLLSTNHCYSQAQILLTIADTGNTIINKNIYGQFAEHLGGSVYDGFYKDGKIRRDIVDALKEIKVPNLRWPGGCFADQYHWRDGIGEKAKRPRTVNTTWGMVTEDNSFGTAEFLELCQEIGCEPYLAGNVGTGSPQVMKEWIEYLNFGGNSTLADLRRTNGHEQPYRVSLWGVGNESWGCGGDMTPEHYADLYRQYASFLPDYPGTRLLKIAGGANADDFHWTETLMKNIPNYEMYGLSMHYYIFPTGGWNPRGSATNFTEPEYAHTLKEALRMQTIVENHEAIMDKYDPGKTVALIVDEWGVWTDVEPGTPRWAMYQQNSLRDALVAASTLNVFNNHADRVRGANLAQTVNVIHSLILTKDDKIILTPTWFVFDLYKVHQNAKLLPLKIGSPLYINGKDSVPAVNASASIDSLKHIHISLVNLDPHQNIKLKIDLAKFGVKKVSGQILTSANVTDINTFETPNFIRIQDFISAKLQEGGLTVEIPSKSVLMLELQ